MLKMIFLSVSLMLMSFLMYGIGDSTPYKYSVSADYSQASIKHGMYSYYTQVGVSYRIFKGLSGGLYAGHYEEAVFFSKHGLLFFGVSADVFILPYFLENDNFLFKPYVPLNLGNMYSNGVGLKWFEEYNIGIGVEVSPLNRFVFHAEYNYGKVFSIKDQRLLLGVSFKF